MTRECCRFEHYLCRHVPPTTQVSPALSSVSNPQVNYKLGSFSELNLLHLLEFFCKIVFSSGDFQKWHFRETDDETRWERQIRQQMNTNILHLRFSYSAHILLIFLLRGNDDIQSTRSICANQQMNQQNRLTSAQKKQLGENGFQF